jgi:hypothetical protein
VQPREDNFTANDSPSLQFLPRHQEAQGWQLETDPIVVPSNRLQTYLEDDAAHFLRYEAIDVTAGRYAGVGHDGFATVEIFRFPDFVKSFGAYSMRKTPTAQWLDIANESFQSKHTIHLWRGPFYVRVIGNSPDPQALRGLTAFVAERMPAAPAKPAVFNFFPADTRVPNSEKFAAESGFGLAFLGNSFQATFNVGGDPQQGLVIPAANRASAAKILDTYRALYVRNGKLLDPIPNLGEDNFTAEDKFMGRVVAFRIDRFVIAFNGYKERQKLVDLAIATDARIIGTIRRQLVKAEKDAEETARPSNEATLPPWARRQ